MNGCLCLWRSQALDEPGTASHPRQAALLQLGQRAARTGRNPATGDKIRIAARKLVKFSPSTSLAGLVDPKFAKARAEKAAAKQAAPAKKATAKATAAPAKKAAAKKAAAKKAT
jgi:DNA-binding protein HU-beta